MKSHRIIGRLMGIYPETRQFSEWSSTHKFSSCVPKYCREIKHKHSLFRPRGVWKWYSSHFLETRPCIANALNTGLVMGIGDVLAQTYLESKGMAGFDIQRAVRFIGLGVILAGPGMCYWYSALDKYVATGTRASTTMRKILLDQVLFLPLYLLIYLIVLALFRGDGVDEIKDRLRRDMYPVLVDSYKVWPLAQAINFYLLPLKFRVFFINIIALFWNSYIGWKAEQKI